MCDEPQFEVEAFNTLLNPQALVEILSDSTEKYDRGRKFADFRTIPSLQEVVFVAQERPNVWSDLSANPTSWTLTEFNSLTQRFQLALIGQSIPLAKIYHGIEVPENPCR